MTRGSSPSLAPVCFVALLHACAETAPRLEPVRVSGGDAVTPADASAPTDAALPPAAPLDAGARANLDLDIPDVGEAPPPDAAPAPRDGAAPPPPPPDAAARADADAPDAQVDRRRFDEVVFMATHNSYSGGSRRTLRAQLDRGVRFLELDVHDNEYASVGDYRVGHDAPGDEVARGGDNPEDDRLGGWLAAIANWSGAHPEHAPITVALDLKDDLTDNPTYAAGNLAALNARLEGAFGDRLLRAEEVPGAWPPLQALRGRVLAVLSGHQGSRLRYRHDVGANPAVAINDRGQVIEVHDSGSGALWYWTGRLDPDGGVEWRRHGRYDAGRTPAVALDDDGVVVEVHASEAANTLWYHVGRLGPDLELDWGPSHRYDEGVRPTLNWSGDLEVHEIHQSQNDGRAWTWTGRVDPRSRTISWGAHGRTDAAPYDVGRAESAAGRIEVYTGPDPGAPAETLRYRTGRRADARIRYAQAAFVESQPGDAGWLAADGLRFFAAAAGVGGAEAAARRRRGWVVRLWGFARPEHDVDPPVSFPATDTPFEAWYLDHADRVGAVR